MDLFLNYLIPIPLKFLNIDSSFKMYITRASLRLPPIAIIILVIPKEREFNGDCSLCNVKFVSVHFAFSTRDNCQSGLLTCVIVNSKPINSAPVSVVFLSYVTINHYITWVLQIYITWALQISLKYVNPLLQLNSKDQPTKRLIRQTIQK